MSKEQTTAVAKADETKNIEFVPFGAKDKVKLSISMVQKLIAVKTKSGKTCSENDAIKFIAMCQARRLNPFEGDAFLIGYDTKDGGATFSLITAHQAFLKRAELNAEYNGMKSGVIVERNGQVMDLEGDFFLEKDKVLGGWATVYFKNRQQPMHKRVRLQRFKKPFGLWLDDEAGMIVKCAEADALRSSFPTMLGGLYLREEIPQGPGTELKITTPIFGAAVEHQPKRKEIEEKPKRDPAAELLELCERDGIAELDLITFLDNELGIGGGEVTSLGQIEEASLEVALNSWEDIAKRIKDAIG